MRNLLSIHANDDFTIVCTFSGGDIKLANVEPLLEGVAFKPLRNKEEFKLVISRGYYIEWPKHELDISADTLWHIGKAL